MEVIRNTYRVVAINVVHNKTGRYIHSRAVSTRTRPAGVLRALPRLPHHHGRISATSRSAGHHLPAVPGAPGAVGTRCARRAGSVRLARSRHGHTVPPAQTARGRRIRRTTPAADRRTSCRRPPHRSGRCTPDRSRGHPRLRDARQPVRRRRTGRATRDAPPPDRRVAGSTRRTLEERPDTVNIIYTAEALATGAGRDGHARTSDGKLDVDLALPTE